MGDINAPYPWPPTATQWTKERKLLTVRYIVCGMDLYRVAATHWFPAAVQNHVQMTDIYWYIDSLSTSLCSMNVIGWREKKKRKQTINRTSWNVYFPNCHGHIVIVNCFGHGNRPVYVVAHRYLSWWEVVFEAIRRDWVDFMQVFKSFFASKNHRRQYYFLYSKTKVWVSNLSVQI